MYKVTIKNPQTGRLSKRVMRDVTIANIMKFVAHLEDVTPISALPADDAWIIQAIEEVEDYE